MKASSEWEEKPLCGHKGATCKIPFKLAHLTEECKIQLKQWEIDLTSKAFQVIATTMLAWLNNLRKRSLSQYRDK